MLNHLVSRGIDDELKMVGNWPKIGRDINSEIELTGYSVVILGNRGKMDEIRLSESV